MKALSNLISKNPIIFAFILVAAIGAILIYIIYKFISKVKFEKLLKSVIKDPGKVSDLILENFSAADLYKNSSSIIKFSKKTKVKLIIILGIDKIWLEQLKLKKSKKDFMRVLNYYPSKGLFTCFLVCLQKKRFLPILLSTLEQSGDLLYMSKIALSGKGEDFDGNLTREIFRSKLQQIREMTGDPEWSARYFAVKVLIHDDDPIAVRAIWEMVTDSHPLVRKTIAKEFQTGESDKFFDILYNMLLHDSSKEVREAAWNRISSDYKTKLKPDFKKFNDVEKLHYLDFLRDGVKQDENLAMTIVEENNLELRYICAIYLDKNNILRKLINEVSFGNMKALSKNMEILKKCCDVNINGFLNDLKSMSNPSGLYIASILLQEYGNHEQVQSLVSKVFSIYKDQEEFLDLYKNTLKCLFLKGNEESQVLLKNELMKRKDDEKSLKIILEFISPKYDYIFINDLFKIFTNTQCASFNAVRDSLTKMSHSSVLPKVLEIVKSERESYPHIIRKEALILLGQLNAHYTLQTILESLPVFDAEEAKDFILILKQFPKPLFVSKIQELLKTNDSKVRASLIAVLPATGEKRFIKSIEKVVKDADPDVRISCVWALVEYEENTSVDKSMSLLRDPVERVRISVAEAMGVHGSKKAVAELKKTIFDKNESDPVKKAALMGLSASSSTNSVDILVNYIEKGESLKDDAILALSHKKDPKSLLKMVENFKDASPNTRGIIAESFKLMRQHSEKSLDNLMLEDIASLKPIVADVLEKTGYIESKIRKLSHKDIQVRRSAAEFLTLVGSNSAFRGIVLASRDPDEEVRIKVIKSLERLEKKDGKEILNSLLNDPDKRVVKYTKWALERLKAKAL